MYLFLIMANDCIADFFWTVFAFSISLVVPADESHLHGVMLTHDVTVVHAVPVECA